MKGLLVLSNGMEDIEALGTRDLLERATIQIETISFNRDKRVKTAFGVFVEADYLAREINQEDYDFLIIPGGKYVSQVIDTDKNIKALVKDFTESKRLVCAICAGPMFLGEQGLLEGKTYTMFPAAHKDAYKGIYQKDKKAVKDGLLITGRGAGAVFEFAYEIIKYLKGEAVAKKVLDDTTY
ncbi:MAG: DJ-1 family glyoxalase III [Acholeplasmataceae bacterium]|jgi:4-methyl-5(b-hydroxyethyl)-thiazole monophosphate biosynthesis